MPSGGRLTLATRNLPDTRGGGDRDRGQWRRHGARSGGARLRAILHHQGGRQGHRPRPVPDPRLRRPDRRPGRVRFGAGGGHDGSASSCRAPRRRRSRAAPRPKPRTGCRRASGCCWSRTMTRCGRSRRICSPSWAARCSAPHAAEEALALLDREQVDLLFTDVVMPGMSGLQLASQVRERARRTCRSCSPAAIARSWCAAPRRASR